MNNTEPQIFDSKAKENAAKMVLWRNYAIYRFHWVLFRVYPHQFGL